MQIQVIAVSFKYNFKTFFAIFDTFLVFVGIFLCFLRLLLYRILPTNVLVNAVSLYLQTIVCRTVIVKINILSLTQKRSLTDIRIINCSSSW